MNFKTKIILAKIHKVIIVKLASIMNKFKKNLYLINPKFKKKPKYIRANQKMIQISTSFLYNIQKV